MRDRLIKAAKRIGIGASLPRHEVPWVLVDLFAIFDVVKLIVGVDVDLLAELTFISFLRRDRREQRLEANLEFVEVIPNHSQLVVHESCCSFIRSTGVVRVHCLLHASWHVRIVEALLRCLV